MKDAEETTPEAEVPQTEEAQESQEETAPAIESQAEQSETSAVETQEPVDEEAQVNEAKVSEPADESKTLNVFQRVLLWVAIVIGGLFFLLGLAGIIGVWAVNTPVTNTLLAILQPIDNTLQRLEVVSGEAARALSETSASLDDADQRVAELGQGLAETNLVREALNQILDVDLEQEVSDARQSAQSIYDTVVAVEETVNAINAIPFVSVEVPGSSQMAEIRTGMEEMAASADELRQENQRRREERAENLVTAITNPLNRLQDRVDELQTRMDNSEARFGQAVERMDALQSAVPRWIDIASIIGTLLLAWLMFSQAAVINLCWQTLHR
jgi:DNA repair exonuclease SbcCD ATPase subunit